MESRFRETKATCFCLLHTSTLSNAQWVLETWFLKQRQPSGSVFKSHHAGTQLYIGSFRAGRKTASSRRPTSSSKAACSAASAPCLLRTSCIRLAISHDGLRLRSCATVSCMKSANNPRDRHHCQYSNEQLFYCFVPSTTSSLQPAATTSSHSVPATRRAVFEIQLLFAVAGMVGPVMADTDWPGCDPSGCEPAAPELVQPRLSFGDGGGLPPPWPLSWSLLQMACHSNDCHGRGPRQLADCTVECPHQCRRPEPL